MPDGRRNNGGARKGAGAPKKEVSLEKIKSMDEAKDPSLYWGMIWKLYDECEDDKLKYSILKLAVEHRWGTPTQSVDHTTDGQRLGNPPNIIWKSEDKSS